MRELRVIGLDVDGRYVVCEDAERGQTYRLPADEQLRAAARGDLTRLGQIEIELEAQLRPREIQARIRAGATIEQVAAVAGLSARKVERYAHPVLLERSKAAEVAQGAHPVLADGPAVATLLHTVTTAFGVRGQDLGTAQWDAWRGEDGRWVVQLRWRTGRSDNHAHWRFQPGAHGGTATALDDTAAELLEPTSARPLRTIAALPVATVPDEPTLVEAVVVDDEAVDEAVEDTAVKDTAVADTALDDTVVVEQEPVPDGSRPAAPAAATSRRARPSMPSWEDVLLGVRSQRG